MRKQVYQYDLKLNKIISTKSKYYFTDTWIRNSYKNFSLNNNILFENFIFLELLKKWYKIYSWKNWTFEFNFIAEKIFDENEIENKIENNTKIYVHISKQIEKIEIKKEIKKLNKIWNDFKKFLIIPEIEKYGFKKFVYWNVKLIENKNSVF